MNKNATRGEWAFLLLICAALMALNVPAQWTGIGTDPDFTGWVEAMSMRMGDGLKLYGDGGHFPVAPLSYVVLHWLSFGHSAWIIESFWNQVAIVAQVLLLYHLTGKFLPRPAALLGALAALATYSGNNTVLFYCSFTNLLAAGVAVVGLVYFQRPSVRNVALLGLLSAATILSKQNVGILAAGGAGLLVCALPAASIKQRIVNALGYIAALAVGMVAISLIMAPWINIPGMIQDVFLIGAECKGGTGEVIKKLLNYGYEIVGLFLLTAFILYSLSGFLDGKAARFTLSREQPQPFSLWWIISVFLGGLVLGLGLSRLQMTLLPGLHATQNIGLMICLIATLVFIHGKFKQAPWPQLGVVTLILFPAAVGFSTSSPMTEYKLQWYVLSIPLLQVALAAMFWLLIAGIVSTPGKYARWIAAAFVMLIIAQNWTPWRLHWVEIKNCADVWADVTWLAHAKVTTRAAPLSQLVEQVKKVTAPADVVLLLPADPNLEACFDRPHAALNCPVMFTDQYWRRYVEDDFKRLAANPPKLILIGPRDHWRAYSQLRNNSGALESLVDRIQAELLPKRYRLLEAKEINYQSGKDYVDVWQRVD